ncbi:MULTISPECIES: hypothetical protein [Streptomyces]|uniref:hypothetical protein n=1 Tax=Streptomyces TaxID=1883 RepID=UPI0006AD2C10|nr:MULTISPECIES: hypothetical protein [Streptomyces]MBT3105214.1 hypothetical protein [Streptomyces sp. COG19]ALC29432.1 hypothetical protein ABE83_21980 [Streptomyces sp. CFMR 7]MBT3074458.1 hypothetical protein [Streptomyces sp. COG21]MBT3083019.1 hypothetical protein [Streptomyces sp. COG20]MBT3085924.1 hypothetical protein [Streptomyces sp. CYG21]
MSGDVFHQYGNHNIGKAEHHGSGDIVAGGGAGPSASTERKLAELLARIEELKPRLSDEDRSGLDEAVGEIGALGPNPEPGRFRRLLQQINGIASLVESGAPVVAAVRSLLTA